MISRFALAASLALAVAACGSNNQPTNEATATAVPSEAASAAPAAVAPSAVPSDASSATPTPTPAAKESEAAEHKDDGKGKAKDSDDQDAAPAGPPQAFNQCSACHSTAPGKTIIGPSLAGVYGHKAGQVAGFQFSDAMKSSGMVLNEKNLDAFLANPMGKVPGTTMAFAGVKDAAQRKAIIAYLKTL
jgi:cytochrome c2